MTNNKGTISAVFSDCGKFRHWLQWIWDDSLPVLPWSLFNPSTAGRANEQGIIESDPTARKGRGFSERLGYGGLVFVNPYDYISTNPKGLAAAGYPISKVCDEYIMKACAMGRGDVVFAHGALGRGLTRPTQVLQMVRDAGYRPMALGFTADGLPRHPLMLSYATELEPMP